MVLATPTPAHEQGHRAEPHTGGSVQVRPSAVGGLSVRDTGPLVPVDRVPELFEPFRRLPPPRTGPTQGAGLGLSIGAAVTDAHHAHLEARPNSDGGLTVTVTLPRTQPLTVRVPTAARVPTPART